MTLEAKFQPTKICFIPRFMSDDVQTRANSSKIIRAIDPDSKGRSGRVPGSQGTWDSLHFESRVTGPCGIDTS
jgi:hypothetical protein